MVIISCGMVNMPARFLSSIFMMTAPDSFIPPHTLSFSSISSGFVSSLGFLDTTVLVRIATSKLAVCETRSTFPPFTHETLITAASVLGVEANIAWSIEL